MHPAHNLPGCTESESHILRLRAQGKSFWQVYAITGIAPRRAHRLYQSGLRKIVDYCDKGMFLEPPKTPKG